MNVLAFDTTSRRGSLALWLGGALAETVSVEAPDGFGSVLYWRIDELLARNAAALAAMDGFAAAAGPGSFTGIRVGLAAAKALGEIHGKPVVAVSNLKAVAAAWRGGGLRVPLLDARRGGEVFAAGYDSGMAQVFPETACGCRELAERLKSRDPTYLAVDPAVFASGGPAEAVGRSARHAVVNAALAASIAGIAAGELAAGRGVDPQRIEANYIRRPDAETNWKGP